MHVTAVAEGLAELGHDVHVLVSPGDNGVIRPEERTGTRCRRRSAAAGCGCFARGRSHRARGSFKPDVIIERYYNFGGEGILAAREIGALAVLEVNAPVVDYPGSLKGIVDRALLVEPMRRWREWQCRHADLIVTPEPQDHPRRMCLVQDSSDRVGRRYGALSSRRSWSDSVHAQ